VFVDQNFEHLKNYIIDRFNLNIDKDKDRIIKNNNSDSYGWVFYIPKSIEDIVDRAGHLNKLDSVETMFISLNSTLLLF